MIRLAVLTGDIVASSDLNPVDLDSAMTDIARIGHRVSSTDLFDPLSWFSRRAGDGWQLAMTSERLAFRTALCIRAQLAAHEPKIWTRIAIALGNGVLPQDRTVDLNHASGPVFTTSGRALEHMERSASLVFQGDLALAACARLFDELSSGWTNAQARTIAIALSAPMATQSEIAVQMGVSRQNVAKSLKAAHYPAIRDALDLIESADDAT